MKVAYLILAHDNPKHLKRLVRSLSSRSATFFIHIDGKSEVGAFSNVTGKDVYIAPERIPVYWGDFSQVEAILTLLRMALAAEGRFDYFVLLSGTDYPLQPTSYIEAFFARNRGKQFMNIVQIPCTPAGKPLSRLTTYKPRPTDSKVAVSIRNRLVKMGVIAASRDYKLYLGTHVPHGGSTWWALSREACVYIRDFVENERQIVSFFKHTVCPDESFFQTVIGNSAHNSNIQRNLTYADWSGGGDSPAYLTEQHIDFFGATEHVLVDDVYGAGEVLFARKFSDEDEDVVMRLDQLISERVNT
jgi:hypothetical protein